MVHGVAKSRSNFTFFLSVVPFGEGNGNPPQCSCLENPMDREAWWAVVYGVEKSRTRLSDFAFTMVALMVKNPPATAGDIKEASSIPGSRRSPGEGHGNPLQCSCLENPMNRGAWWAIVHRVTKSWTRLK